MHPEPENQSNDEASQIKRAIFTALAFLSIMGLMIVAGTIYTNKKLNAHPSPLIATICLVEAIMCWNALFRFLGPAVPVCYFKLY